MKNGFCVGKLKKFPFSKKSIQKYKKGWQFGFKKGLFKKVEKWKSIIWKSEKVFKNTKKDSNLPSKKAFLKNGESEKVKNFSDFCQKTAFLMRPQPQGGGP